MVEGGHQPDVFAAQHAVAEHVAAHVADSHDGEILGLGIDSHLPEVPLDRLPRALGGDAHLLVVVADRPAGRERVTQPVAVGLGNVVGDVGEAGGPLVGGHHQVRVVSVTTHDLRRRADRTGGVVDVVGDVEQAGDEQRVAGDPFVAGRLAIRDRVTTGRRWVFDHEPAFGSGRDDDGVLDLLRFDQAEDLGAIVLASVGPAQPAARYEAEPQVHALDTG